MIATVVYAYFVMNGSVPWDLTYFASAAMVDGALVILLLSE